MVNGKIVYAAQEERFTGLKTDYGQLMHKDGLKFMKIDTDQISEVSLATKILNPILTKIKRECNFSVDDYVLEQENTGNLNFTKIKRKTTTIYLKIKCKIKTKFMIINLLKLPI